jgi:hypothetical protein
MRSGQFGGEDNRVGELTTYDRRGVGYEVTPLPDRGVFRRPADEREPHPDFVQGRASQRSVALHAAMCRSRMVQVSGT